MTFVLVAIVGALATATIGPLLAARAEVRRHDRQIAARDEDLEDWVVVRNRRLKQRFDEVRQQAASAGVARGVQRALRLLARDFDGPDGLGPTRAVGFAIAEPAAPGELDDAAADAQGYVDDLLRAARGLRLAAEAEA